MHRFTLLSLCILLALLITASAKRGGGGGGSSKSSSAKSGGSSKSSSAKSTAKKAASAIAAAKKKNSKKKRKNKLPGEPEETGEEFFATDTFDDDDDDDDDLCFPAEAEVTLASGARRAMADVAIGDSVLVADGVFSEVFAFTHRISEGENEFVSLATDDGELVATAGHYVYANGALVPAGSVVFGDVLTGASGAARTVVGVETVTRRGLYNPQTLHGDIVVDGFVASTYTTAVEPRVAHAALAAWRWVYGAFGLSSRAFEGGAGAFTAVLPVGY